MIDLVALFDRHRIEWSHDNAAKGNVSVHCPLCGPADGGHHLQVHLEKGVWKCWKNPKRHKGGPVLLLSILLRIDHDAAEALLGFRHGVGDIDGLIAALQERRDPGDRPKFEPERRPLRMPREFRKISEGRFEDYLLGRGFDWESLPALARDFDLRSCMTGRYRWRLVIPVYLYDRLVGWTARSLARDAKLRYSSLSDDPELAQPYSPAPVNIKSTLLHFDSLVEDEGRGLFVVEGPLDAVKLDWYARPYGYRATCLYGLAASDVQLALLDRLRLNYDYMLPLFDPGAEFSGLDLSDAAPDLNMIPLSVPDGIEDPGAMTPAEVEEFCDCVTARLSARL